MIYSIGVRKLQRLRECNNWKMNCVATKVSLKSKDEIMKTLDDSGGNI
jgi:hypothetical protein